MKRLPWFRRPKGEDYNPDSDNPDTLRSLRLPTHIERQEHPKEEVVMGVTGYQKFITYEIPMAACKIRDELLAILRTGEEVHLMKIAPENLLVGFREGASTLVLDNGLVVDATLTGENLFKKGGQFNPVSLADIKMIIKSQMAVITNPNNWWPGKFNGKMVATICLSLKDGKVSESRSQELAHENIAGLLPFKKK